MSDIIANRATGFVRCAVCKIDLKGRFVYVDDGVEALLGCTREELFGRPLMAYLDPSNEPLVDQLLSHRNHYETFHDATILTVINSQGQATSTRAIASLNFAAGNPVNFQLILDIVQDTGTVPETADRSLPTGEFVSALLAMEGPGELREFLELAREFAGADQASVYLIADDGLEPRAGASADRSVEHAFKTIPQPSDLYLRIAREDGEYSLLDDQAVAAAIEHEGEAPAELVCPLLWDGGRYLLTMSFDPDQKISAQCESVERARLAIGLGQRLFADSAAASEEQLEVDIRFTVGFLDHLGIGAILTRGDGGIVGYNRAVSSMLGGRPPGETPREFFEQLAPCNRSSHLAPLLACFEPTQPAERSDVRLDLSLPDGQTARLALVWLAESPDDLSSAIVVMPGGSGGSMAVQGEDFWVTVISLLRDDLVRICDGVQHWSHHAYDTVPEESNCDIRAVSAAARTMRATLQEMADLVRLIEQPERAELTDLNLLIRDICDEVGGWYPEVKATCVCRDLPKVIVDRERLGRVLQVLFATSMKHRTGSEFTVSLDALVENEKCFLMFADDGAGMPPELLSRIGDLRRPAHSHVLSLNLSRALLQSMGGEMHFEADTATGIRATLALPCRSMLDERGQPR